MPSFVANVAKTDGEMGKLSDNSTGREAVLDCSRRCALATMIPADDSNVATHNVIRRIDADI
jgi:hypothetical protein